MDLVAVLIALFSFLLISNTLQAETRSIIIAYPVFCLKSNNPDESEEVCLLLFPVKCKKAILSSGAALQPEENRLR